MNGDPTGNPRSGPLLDVRDLHVRFGARRREVAAVRGVSFAVAPGEILGLIGESGSGKTTVARTIAGLIRPAAGSVRFEGEEILGLSGRALRRVRRRLHLIFQDPYDSLHPGMRVSEIVEEPMKLHGAGDRERRKRAALAALEEVGLTPVSRFAGRYAHQLSGGQRQRVAIARALVLDPVLVLADEPTSMLDVSLRAGILEILERHRETHGTGYLFITHDLALARHFCDRVAVMYAGRLVELGPAETVVSDPRHPYTQTLLRAVEDLSPNGDYLPDRARHDETEEKESGAAQNLQEVTPGHYVARKHTPDKEE
jgi:peptide/nickel transport system ATP-binding protein